MNGIDRSVRCRLVEFEVMTEQLRRYLEAWRIESVIGAGIDDELRRDPFALLPRGAPIVTALHHGAALLGRHPIVELTDQDQGWNRHVAPEYAARRIEGDGGAEFGSRGLLDDTVFDGDKCEPAALRKAERRDARGIDEGLPRQIVQGAIGVEAEIDRRAVVAGVLQTARPETVDRQRHITPGGDPLAPALVEPQPIAVATMQQHDGGRGARAAGLTQIALQRLRLDER